MLDLGGLILSVYKPTGWTSFDVVNKLRKELGWKKVGHAGTLDPPADGVLILLFGEATARSAEFMDLGKEYRARIRFGLSTATDDLEGRVTQEYAISNWSQALIENALESFRGIVEQIPPAVSAVKIRGRRSYARARAGELELPQSRPVHFYTIDMTAICEPEIELLITCSRGTYIRALARDLGQSLGWGGALASLTRTAIGPYRIERAALIEEVIHRSNEFDSI